jgi:acetyl esterase/lipase
MARPLLSAALFTSLALSIVRATEPPAGKFEPDLPYVSDGKDEHKLDLYLPSKEGFTTVVFTYGGGWQKGTRKSVVTIGESFQKLGYGCALLSHRLGPAEKFPAQAEDVAAGFAWVKANIAKRGGDPKKVVLAGHSSGAHLSLLIASDPQYLAVHKLTPKDVFGVVGLSTPTDLEPRDNKSGFGDALMGGRGADTFGRDPKVLKDASPIRYLTKDLPPTLLVVGEKDFPMLEADAKVYAEKAKAAGVEVTVYSAQGKDHMGVVAAVREEKDPVREKVVEFLAGLK